MVAGHPLDLVLRAEDDGHPLVQLRGRDIEDSLSEKLLFGDLNPGSIVVVDVSGSMDKYSFFLLRFVWAGHSVARVEATARALSALLKDAPQRHLQHAAQAGAWSWPEIAAEGLGRQLRQLSLRRNAERLFRQR